MLLQFILGNVPIYCIDTLAPDRLFIIEGKRPTTEAMSPFVRFILMSP